MDTPRAFHKFSGFFYPRGYEEFASEDEWIAHNFNVLSAQERAILKQFLDELLSGPYSDADLADIWASTTPTYDFRRGGHRVFFKKVRDMMEKN
jgi:hypothetical protein